MREFAGPRHLMLFAALVLFAILQASSQNRPSGTVQKNTDSTTNASAVASPSLTPTLTIFHFDVGTGDSTLIVFDNQSTDAKTRIVESALIDGGDKQAARNAVIPGLIIARIATLNYVISTHYDRDHREGLQTVLQAFHLASGGVVFDRDRGWPSAKGTGASAATAENRPLQPGSVLTLGPASGKHVEIKCVAANGGTASWHANPPLDENASSMAFLVTFGKFKYFIGGDLTGGGKSGWSATPDIESAVAAEVGEVNVLRINHHGSNTSSNQGFLSVLNPVVAIISAGKTPLNDKLFHWPSRKVLDRIKGLPRLDAVYISGAAGTPGGLTDDDKKKVKDLQGTIKLTNTGEDTFEVNHTLFPIKKEASNAQ